MRIKISQDLVFLPHLLISHLTACSWKSLLSSHHLIFHLFSSPSLPLPLHLPFPLPLLTFSSFTHPTSSHLLCLPHLPHTPSYTPPTTSASLPLPVCTACCTAAFSAPAFLHCILHCTRLHLCTACTHAFYLHLPAPALPHIPCCLFLSAHLHTLLPFFFLQVLVGWDGQDLYHTSPYLTSSGR